ncbi:MAG: hypothetical protein J6A01_10140 [Proteobacteria bacterium]|nr:hypothetical protein [Pseudomonadota bacterium]
MKLSRINIIMIFVIALSMILCFSSCKANKADTPQDKVDSAEDQKLDTQNADDTQPEQANEKQAKEDPNTKPGDQEAPSANAPADSLPKTLPAYQYLANDPIQKAVADYLTHEIAKNFAPADVSIPSISIVATDTSNPDDTLVWGDFWIFNYKLENDMLVTESGGSHPGLMHLKKADESYTVTKMDIVADGSDNLKSAKEIFGDKYDDFHKINSNQDEREKIRRQYISDYVKNNKLSITKIKDFGWDPVELP